MNMRDDMKAVVKRKMLEFLLHFIASVVNEFLYSGKNGVFFFCWCNTCVCIAKRVH